jgi:hypothetical protein
VSPEVVQLIYLAAAAAIGWLLRHRLGPLSGSATGPGQQPNPLPRLPVSSPDAQHPLLDNLTKFVLEKISEAIKNAPVAPPK